MQKRKDTDPVKNVTPHNKEITMTKGTIDRFEGEYAVVEMEDGSMKDIPISALPKDVKEGESLQIDGDKVSVGQADKERQEPDLWSYGRLVLTRTLGYYGRQHTKLN